MGQKTFNTTQELAQVVLKLSEYQAWLNLVMMFQADLQKKQEVLNFVLTQLGIPIDKPLKIDWENKTISWED
jgi:hypothetical protein